MPEIFAEIFVAALALIGTLGGSYMANSKTTAVMQVEMNHIKKDMSDMKDEMKTDIKELDEKVHKHNNLVERMAIVEQSTKSAHHRIDEINKHNS